MMRKKKTLVFLSPGFPESEADSSCLPLQQCLARQLKQQYPAMDVEVLTFHYPYARTRYTIDGVCVTSFNGRNKGGLQGWLLKRKVHQNLEKLLHTKEIIGLVSFWFGETAVVGRAFAKKHGLKHFCWILGQDARSSNPHPARQKPQGEELIALSDFLQEEFFRNHGVKPFKVIEPGIPDNLCALPALSRDIDLLGAGALIPLKQYGIFVEVVSELKRHRPDIKTIIAGSGTERQNLQLQINKLGLQENILLAGQQSYHDLMRMMGRAKVFLHPSSYEGFGCVCIEALAAGAKVISSCKPLYRTVSNWHIAPGKIEMIKLADELLDEGPASAHSEEFRISATAEKMMQLFQ